MLLELYLHYQTKQPQQQKNIHTVIKIRKSHLEINQQIGHKLVQLYKNY